MAQKFNSPTRATGGCDVWFEGCVGTGTLQECTKICGGETATAKRAFRQASGRKVPCLCGGFAQSEEACKIKCSRNPDEKRLSATGTRRVVNVRPQGKNANFMMATGRASTMSDFLHEVGLIVVAVGVWYYVAAPILKKVGLKPLNI